MKSILSATIVTLSILASPWLAKAESSRNRKPISCPTVVDRETGKFSTSRSKYRCYSDDSSARKAGFRKHSFVDSSSCLPTPAPTPVGGGISGDYNLAGPGERETVVFSAPIGGVVTYSFAGGGQFEIKVLSASRGDRLQRLIETTQAGTGSIAFSGQTIPVTIKVEGPGAWTVAVEVNQ